MPQGFWEARQTAKEGGIAGVAGSVNWGEKFRSIPQRLSEFSWKARSWLYRPAKPTYSGEIIFRQQFGGSTAYYAVESAQEEEPAIQIDYREGYAWVTWYSGAPVGEDTDRSDVKREIRITYWIKSNDRPDIGKIRNWLDKACQNALRDRTPLDEVLNWHNAEDHYEVYEAATGRVAIDVSDFELEIVDYEYWNRQTNKLIKKDKFRK